MKHLYKVFVLLFIATFTFVSCDLLTEPEDKETADTTAPAEVTSVSESSGDTEVVVSWTDPTDSDLASVLIYNGSTLVATVAAGTETYTVTGLTNGTSYTFTAITVDRTGNESTGIDFSAATPTDTTSPSEATDLNAVAGDNQAILTWTDPTDADLASILIYNGSTLVATVDAETETYTVTGLTNGTAYTFTAIAVDADSNESTGSDFAAVTPADTTAPSDVTDLSAVAGDTVATLTWTDPTDADLTSVQIYNGSTLVTTVDAETETYTVTGLTNGTSYTFTAIAVDDDSNESAGSDFPAVTPADTSAPAEITSYNAASGDTVATLTWTDPTDSDLASILIYNGSTLVATVDAETETYTVTGLTNGTDYTFSATTTDTTGNESTGIDFATVTPTATPDTTAPAEVTGLNAVAGDTEVTLTWTDPTDSDLTSVLIYNGSTLVATVTADTETYTVTGLTNGTTYTFTATTIDGNSNESTGTDFSAVTPADTTAPAEVTNLNAVAGDTEVTLTWTDPTDSDLTSVLIYNGSTLEATIAAGTQTYTVTGLTNGTAYTFTAKTIDGNSNESTGTDFSAVTPADTTAPAEVTNLGSVAGDTEATLTWTDPTDSDLASVKIYNGSTLVTTVTAGTETYTVTGLTNGTEYTFTATTVDGDSNESTGEDFAAVTPADTTAPAEATNLASTAGDTEATLTWSDPADSDLASVLIYNGSTLVATVDAGTETYTVTSLTNDTAYTFTAKTVDGDSNESTGSDFPSVTPVSATVSVPQALHDWGFTYDGLPTGTSGTINIDDTGSAAAVFTLKESGFDYGSSADGAYITGVDSADGTANGAIKSNFVLTDTVTATGYYYNNASAGVGINTIDVTTESFTVEAVINASVVSGYSDDVTLVEFYDSGAGSGWKLYLESSDASIKMKTMAGIDTSDLDNDGSTTDTLSNECKTTSGIVSGQSSFTASVDTWYHITAVYDIDATGYGTYGAVFIYIDGVLLATKDANYPLVQNSETDKLIIGGGSTGSNKNFNGSIDNVAIWEGALTAEQIAARAEQFGF